jgi:hypothetical protein
MEECSRYAVHVYGIIAMKSLVLLIYGNSNMKLKEFKNIKGKNI